MPIIEKEPFKIRIRQYREYMEKQVRRNKIEVRLNTEVTKELVERLKPDVLIAAVGGHPIIPKIPGIDKAVQIVEYYRREPEIGNKVLVLGGGFAGVECAIGLAQKGKDVTIIEGSSALASGPNTPYPGTGAMQIDALWTNIKKNGVKVELNTFGVEITDNGMVCRKKDGSLEELKADCVIVATGISPNTETVEELRDTVIDFAWIGDCYSPGLIRMAVSQGFDTALGI